MQMVGRTWNLGAEVYRFGFNGKENDNEVKGEGNQQDYGMRIYDPRVGRFLSVDPLTKTYPMLTPYQFASNIPTRFIDLDGEESFNPLTRFFITDAAITLAKNPTSAKAKVYGVALGVGGAVHNVITNTGQILNTAAQGGSPTGAASAGWSVFKGAEHFAEYAGKSPEQRAAEYGVNLYGQYSSLPDGVRDAAILGHVGGDLAISLAPFKVKGGEVAIELKTSAIPEELLGWEELEHRAVMSDNPLSVAASTDGKTFRAVVQNIEAEYGGNTWELISDLNKQASKVNASRIEIKGIEIVNDKYKKIFSEANGKTLMGYQVEYKVNKGYGEVILSKELPTVKK